MTDSEEGLMPPSDSPSQESRVSPRKLFLRPERWAPLTTPEGRRQLKMMVDEMCKFLGIDPSDGATPEEPFLPTEEDQTP